MIFQRAAVSEFIITASPHVAVSYTKWSSNITRVNDEIFNHQWIQLLSCPALPGQEYLLRDALKLCHGDELYLSDVVLASLFDLFCLSLLNNGFFCSVYNTVAVTERWRSEENIIKIQMVLTDRGRQIPVIRSLTS